MPVILTSTQDLTTKASLVSPQRKAKSTVSPYGHVVQKAASQPFSFKLLTTLPWAKSKSRPYVMLTLRERSGRNTLRSLRLRRLSTSKLCAFSFVDSPSSLSLLQTLSTSVSSLLILGKDAKTECERISPRHWQTLNLVFSASQADVSSKALTLSPVISGRTA